RLADAEQGGFFAVHRDIDLRIVFLAADLDVREPRRLVHDRVDLADQRARLFKFVAVDLDVNGRLRSEAYDALHDPAGVEDHQHAGEELLHIRTHFVHDLDLVAVPPIRRDEIDM